MSIAKQSEVGRSDLYFRVQRQVLVSGERLFSDQIRLLPSCSRSCSEMPVTATRVLEPIFEQE